MAKKLFEEKQFVSKNIFGVPVSNVSPRRVECLLRLNLFLVILIGVFGIWYAIWVNLALSVQYQERLFKEKLESLVQENNRLLSEKSNWVNLGALLVFAKNAGLVEQRNIEYLFDRSNLAEVPHDLAH